MAAYATKEELADALGRTVTAKDAARYQACVDAAAVEIDHYVCRREDSPIPEGEPLSNRVCVLRAVEWAKANEAAFGVIGYDQTGVLTAPRNGFKRHQATLIPLKQKFGIA